MNAKTIYRSLPLKIAALFLTVLVGTLCITTGVLLIFMYDKGYYEPNVNEYYQTRDFSGTVWRYSMRVYDAFTNGDDPADYGVPDHKEDTNYAYELAARDDPQDVLASNYVSEGEAQFTTEYIGDYIIRSYVRKPLTAQDSFYTGQLRFNQLFPYRFTAIFWCAISLVAGLALLAYLLCAAGRRPGTEDVILNVQDRIPFDLYLAVAAPLTVAIIISPIESLNFSEPYHYGILAAFLALALIVCLSTLMTFATRAKAGKWWRNTIIYRLLCLFHRGWRGLWRGLGMIAREIPVLWKAALAFCAMTFINFLLAMWFFNYYEGFPFFIGVLFNLVMLLAVCYIGLCMQQLKRAGKRLAAGDLDSKADTRHLRFDFLEHAENLNAIGDGMARAVEQRMRSERLKTELITNVSHDIKTPLTSIINYVDLLGKEELPEQAAEYVEVLERQARRLGKLTEDLVEASKASTGNLQLDLQRTGMCELVGQAVGEYSERLEDCQLDMVVTAPEQELYALADGRHLWRVLDNLLSNACKYSLPGTRVYVDVRQDYGEVTVAFKNISRDQLNIAGDELTERFVRGDLSRHTEGSGLGLNIARSLVELQGGRFNLLIDGDLFKVEVHFPAVP